MRNIFKNKWVWVAVIIVMFGVWRWRVGANRTTNGTKERVVMAEKREVFSTLTISGEIKAEKQAILNFPISGKLAYISVKNGDSVKKGQVLASLDLGDLEANQTKAYYAYLSADAYAKKIEDEIKGHDADETFTQKYTRVSAQTTRDAAYDTWLSARRAVENARLVAPFAGIVTNVTSNVVGDTISVGDGATVVEPKSLYFEGEIDETDIGKLPATPKIDVSLDAFSGATFSGTLENIGFASRLSSTGATVYPVKIKLSFGSAQNSLRLGMNGDAKIILDERKNVIAVPVDAVVDGHVTKKNGEVKQVKVEVGLEGDIYTEIKSGLSEGDQIIIK